MREEWEGEHRTSNFMYKVHHAPYFVGCIIEHALKLYKLKGEKKA